MDFVDPILSLCMGIYQMAENVKANKESCQRVADRVRTLEELVLTIKQRGPGQMSAVVENALKELCNTLALAKRVLIKYSQTKKVENFLKSRSHKDKFRELNNRLTESFQVLSGALQIEQVNMLHTVCEASSGRSPNGVDFNGQTLTGTMPPMSSSTTPMPLSSTSSMSSPTTPMPLSSTSSMSSPTTPMPLSSTSSMSSPTTPMPLSSTSSMSSPTTPMPLSSTRSMSSHRPSMPLSSIMPPHMAPMPFFTMATMPFFSTMATMPFFSTMAPRPFFSTMAPRPVIHVMAPCPRAPVSPATLTAQLTFPSQNNSVVGNYVVNNSFNT
ncbi:hypothetical protein VZT92_024104 [Zoarces viviparus]